MFHGKSGDRNTEKLDKYEKKLFAEDSNSKSSTRDVKTNQRENSKTNIKQTRENSKPDFKQQRENSRTEFNPAKHQNGQQNDNNRRNNRGNNDQDFGQWGGGPRRQNSNLSKEESLTNGLQNMNLGGKNQNQQNNNKIFNNDQQQQRVNRTDRRNGDDRGHGDGRGRGRGGQGYYQPPPQRQSWHEGQRCMAKYWEVIHNIM